MDLLAGRTAEAHEQLQRVLRVHEETGDRRGVGATAADLASLDLEVGDLASARTRIGTALEIARARGEAVSEGILLSGLAVATEEPRRAVALLEEAEVLLQDAPAGTRSGHALHRARVAWRQHDPEGARAALARAEALATADPLLRRELERVRALLGEEHRQA
jgi:hypothetical protein